MPHQWLVEPKPAAENNSRAGQNFREQFSNTLNAGLYPQEAIRNPIGQLKIEDFAALAGC